MTSIEDKKETDFQNTGCSTESIKIVSGYKGPTLHSEFFT